MSDGAHLGYDAESAMRKIIAGDDLPAPITTKQMLDRIMATTRATATSYSGMSDYVAKLIILAFWADPALAQAPTERTYGKKADGETDWSVVVTPDLWDRIKDVLSPDDLEAISGITGFMWGWAVNAARACMELAPVANPAIITIGGTS